MVIDKHQGIVKSVQEITKRFYYPQTY